MAKRAKASAKIIKNKNKNKNKNDQSSKNRHPDHQELIPRLRRAQGQVDAVARMIYEKEYCPSIIQQLRAARAALKALEAQILETHLEHCVHAAMKSKSAAEAQKKISELIVLFKRGND